ncbi:MAG: hypothetical protein EXR71_04835 [Myxococcales bacterium]|nr:hypothetical protein [Myxococcales bacterium]
MTALLALLLAAPGAEAGDHRGRFGFGFHAGLGDVAALSARYSLPTATSKVNVQLEINGGVALSSEAPLGVLVGGRLLYGVVAEDNLTLYAAAGAAYVQESSWTGIRVLPAIGAEFFLFGLENLGFGVEWGVQVDVGSEFALRTVSGAPAVTVHYWF